MAALYAQQLRRYAAKLCSSTKSNSSALITVLEHKHVRNTQVLVAFPYIVPRPVPESMKLELSANSG